MIYIQMGENETTIEILNEMDTRIEMDKGELAIFMEENYPDFSKTTEFLDWKSD